MCLMQLAGTMNAADWYHYHFVSLTHMLKLTKMVQIIVCKMLATSVLSIKSRGCY